MAKPAPGNSVTQPRPPSSWHDKPGQQSRTVAALRKARALENVEASKRGEPGAASPAQQRWRSFGTAVASVFGILVFLCSLIFLAGSIYIGQVLQEIAQRDFSGPIERISQYEVFFEEIAKAGYSVRHDDPSILDGVTTYLWTVQPPGSDELRVFHWELNLAENKLLAQTSAAVYLDIKLEFTTPDEAVKLACYEPNDTVSLSIVNSDSSLLKQAETSGWQGKAPEGPVMAPLISPEEAMKRGGAAKPAEEEVPAEGEVAAEEGQQSQAVEVGAGDGEGGDTPPATNVGDGEGGNGGGEETPPADPDGEGSGNDTPGGNE